MGEFVEPLGKRILIRKDESRQKTRGGIVLPDQAEIPTITGRVVEISALGVYAVKGPADENARQVLNTSPDALSRVIESAIDGQDKEEVVVIVRADRKTPHEAVVRALSVSRQLGLVRITFATQLQPDG